MATTDTTVSNLIINKLTKAQYDAIQSPSDTELYLIPDEIDNVPTSGSDNPVKSGGVYSALAGKANSTDLATVATSGSYNDLSDKPTIPDAVSGTNDGTNWTSITIGSTTKAIPSGGAELPSNTAYLSNDSGEGIVPDDGIKAVTVTSAAAMTISPDVVTAIDGAVGASVFTLQVPNDNLAHVWDILFTSAASGIPSFVMSDSSSIKYPSGYSIGASKAVEVSVIGVGETYYLRYGEFA